MFCGNNNCSEWIIWIILIILLISCACGNNVLGCGCGNGGCGCN